MLTCLAAGDKTRRVFYEQCERLAVCDDTEHG